MVSPFFRFQKALSNLQQPLHISCRSPDERDRKVLFHGPIVDTPLMTFLAHRRLMHTMIGYQNNCISPSGQTQ